MRQGKGHDIARRYRNEMRRDGGLWLVPSQSGRGLYTVDLRATPPTCTCPDYELTARACKHIYAAKYTEDAEKSGTPDFTKPIPFAKPPRPTYSQDWPAYNAAQTNEKHHFQALLADLCEGIEEPAYTYGRPRLPFRDMLFAVCFKVYSTVSARRFACDLADAHSKGYLSRVPHFNSVLNYLELPEMTPLLRSLITETARAMRAVETNFAVDSTGFSTCQYVRWYDAKYGREVDMRDWMTVHVMCGVTTNIVTSVEITGRYTSDSVMFQPLVEATAKHFTLGDVTADKAYLSRSNLAAVVERGGTPYIPFKVNSAREGQRTSLWDVLYHHYMVHRELFLDHYHKRSLSETTFSMIKAKFGVAIRSKGEVAQVNELLAKILCHNVCCVVQSMYELGIEPDFWR